MNSFMNNLEANTNYTFTENGGVAHRSTLNPVYDLFALGASYRTRSDEDCIVLFMKAYNENPELALKCLFWIRDCRGGAGERRFFRVVYHYLCEIEDKNAWFNLKNISEYGRWDDLIYIALGTKFQDAAFEILKKQLGLDIQCKTPSLCAKWMPSENASSYQTKAAANAFRKYLGMTHKQYRKMLSILRERINIVERLMSENRWDEIVFDQIPSKAGLIYKNAFARRDIIKQKYETFAKSKDTKVNAATLYPYEVVAKAIDNFGSWSPRTWIGTDVDRAMINKYWENLPDYLNGKPMKMMCVVDTSGSMCGNSAAAPINIAISLGMYCAERLGGPFKNHYISFSSRPQLIETIGTDFCDKVCRIYETNLCSNTNLAATFDLLLETAKKSDPEDIPETIVVISDMEIDYMSTDQWSEKTTQTEMEKIKAKWRAAGIKCPNLVYWNVNARHDTILDAGPDVSFVSGASPTIFKQVLTGKTGWDLCLEAIDSPRYERIKLFNINF